MKELAASALVTLLVTIAPLEVAAVFKLLTDGARRPEKKRIALRGVTIAGIVLIVFAFVGMPLLRLMHVSFPAFQVAGGILLGIQAVDLVLAHRSGFSSITPTEEREAERAHDIVVFPLAIPLIAGPGSMTALILLMGEAGTKPLSIALVLGTLVFVLALTYWSLALVDGVSRLLGVTGTNVVARISGILLAALAVQFVLDGVRAALGG